MRCLRGVIAAVLAAAIFASSTLAAPPKGAVKGRFTVGFLAESDELSSYVRASNVFCAWSKGRVMVHVNLKNTSAAHLTMTVKPRYKILRGGEHGSGLTSAKDFGFDAGEFRSLWIDAGSPKGIAPKSKITECSPYLFLIEAG